MATKPINYTVLVTAISWVRYWNEKKRLNNDVFIPESATELSTLWGLGEIEAVSDEIGTKVSALGVFQDPWMVENIRPKRHILFQFAPCAPIDGIRLGNPGQYIVPQFAIYSLFTEDDTEINPSVCDIVSALTHIPSIHSEGAPHANGGHVHSGQSSSAPQLAVPYPGLIIPRVF